MNVRFPTRLAVVALALGLTLGVAGCAPAEDTRWRELVEQAAQQASTGDYATADSTLVSLEQNLAAARDAGRLDTTRAEQISAAIATVRGDLATLSPAPPATPEPSDTPAPSTSSVPSQTPPSPSTPSTPSSPPTSSAPPTTEVPDDSDDDTSDGKGKDDKGKGNGNSGRGNDDE